mgnify:FL=1
MVKSGAICLSYDTETRPIQSPNGFSYQQSYRCAINGIHIIRFVESAKKYSGHNVSEVRKRRRFSTDRLFTLLLQIAY